MIRDITTEPSVASAPHRGLQDLNELLLQFQQRGLPQLHCFNDGTWTCLIKIHTAAPGTSFEIKSDYTHRSPLEAALQCQERMIEALSKLERRT